MWVLWYQETVLEITGLMCAGLMLFVVLNDITGCMQRCSCKSAVINMYIYFKVFSDIGEMNS